MKKLLNVFGAAVLTAFALAPVTASAQQSTWDQIQTTKKLRLGAPISEPFHFKDQTASDAPGAVKSGDATWRGLTPNIAKQLAEALGVELEIVETTYGTAIAGLQANQFDMIIALDGTPARAAAIDFVSSSPFWYGTALVAKEETNIETWEAINGAKLNVGVNVGTINAADVARRAPDAQLSNFQSVPEMIAAFQAGRVQAIALSLTSMTIASARLPGTKVRMPEPTSLYPVGTAIRKETDPRWKNFLEASIRYLAQSGFVQEQLDLAYKFRGIDTTKIPPVLTR